MGLTRYQTKRRFDRTPEPAGKKGTSAGVPAPELIYVIQKHRATHLHWDLRLEEGGVLKSWAVPKEPPTEAGVKRLAVEVEDHPLEYASFEGTIPAGEYGGGKVEIWDRGTYRVLEATPAKRWIEITGTRLRGPYILLKLKPAEKDDRNWLFFKLKPKEP
ncbi:MAG: 3'-phosphoesterase [Candidatus Aminicenantes bacterium]|nr:3'-phosphoesterase [Candidatus Aminicenantes bacterium]